MEKPKGRYSLNEEWPPVGPKPQDKTETTVPDGVDNNLIEIEKFRKNFLEHIISKSSLNKGPQDF